ncbi:MAG: prepilin-type N-terminal cleavage/methylation domain-containing protein [Myxococcales bacterium]
MRNRPVRGFTLLEVLIAAMLLVIGLVGSIALIGGLVLTNRTAHSRDVAYALLQQTLDQEMMVPLLLPPTAGLANQYDLTNNSGVATVPWGPGVLGGPLCFASSDDVVADRPTPCSAAMAAAFILRTWTCCATAGVDPGVGGAPYGIPAGVCGFNPNILPGDGVLGSGWTAVTTSGTLCYLQAEVTWPNESQPVGAAPVSILGTGAAKNLFQEVDVLDGLSMKNHAYASMVREQ